MLKRRAPLLFSLALAGLVACSNPDPAAPTGPAVPMPQIQGAIDNSTPDAARRGMADKTWLWAGGGPAQIHYSTADGRDFAWVVGQRRIFAGEWQVNTAPGANGQSIVQICLRYPGVRLSGLSSDWSCRPAGEMFYGGQVSGPVFAKVASESLKYLGVAGDAPISENPG